MTRPNWKAFVVASFFLTFSFLAVASSSTVCKLTLDTNDVSHEELFLEIADMLDQEGYWVKSLDKGWITDTFLHMGWSKKCEVPAHLPPTFENQFCLALGVTHRQGFDWLGRLMLPDIYRKETYYLSVSRLLEKVESSGASFDHYRSVLLVSESNGYGLECFPTSETEKFRSQWGARLIQVR